MKRTLLYKTMLAALLLSGQQIVAQTSWVTKTSGVTDTLYAVQFLDTNNGFVCGDNGTVLRTTDGGSTWTDASISTTNPVRDISFISTTTGWAAVGDVNDADNTGELWKTTDGGASWTNQPYYSTRARLGISFADANTGWACGSRNGPLDVANTTDGGSAWTEQTDGAIFGWTYKVDALSSTDMWTVGGAFFPSVTGLIIHSTDGGNTWNLQSVGTIAFTYDVEAVDANTIYVAGDAGFVMATTDGGANWNTQTTGTTDILWRISFSSTSTGLACGDNGTIVGTTDSGTNWATETSGVSTTLNGIFMLDGTTAWAVGAGGTIIKRVFGLGLEYGQGYTPKVKVFPNPFNARTTITIENAHEQDDLTFILFDALGNEVSRRIITSQSFTFEAAELAKGIYHYTINGNPTGYVSGEIIIQ